MKDLFGQAMLDFYTNNNPSNITTETSISDADEMDIAYMFRNYKDMPPVEQEALDRSYGKVLDIGCGAGSHALYLQNNKKLDITAIDFSENAIQTCRLRGLKNAKNANLFDFYTDVKFDTILLLMNGTGICGKISNLNKFIQKIKSLLSKDGQILIDSTDIRYMYDRDNEDNIILPFDMNYFGELQFFLTYKNQKCTAFDWLYLDFETLKNYCKINGMLCDKIIEEKNHEYLAKIVIP